MPNPTFTFGFLIATLYGAIFHLILGGGARRLALFLGTSWFGFAAGHFTGVWFQVTIFKIGAIHFFSATAGTFFALALSHVMTQTRSRRSPQR